jgi:hypothetical protein
VGALLFDSTEAAVKLAHFLTWDIRLPVVVIGQPVPPELQGAPAGAASVGEDLKEAMRSLLVLALNPAPLVSGMPAPPRTTASTSPSP